MSWQDIIVGIVVGACAVYLAWAFVRFLWGRSASPCGGGCCGGSKAHADRLGRKRELVQLGGPPDDRDGA